MFSSSHAQLNQVEQRRDPTKPPEISLRNMRSLSGGFSVSSILISTHRQLAVIDGQFVKKGDTINGAEVISIKPNTVELDYKGKRLIRYLIHDQIANLSIKKKE